MKRFLVLLMAALMVFGMVGSAFATSSADGVPTPAAEAVVQAHHPKIKDLQGYDQLLQLRAEGKATREQIKGDRDQLKPLVQKARQDHNKAALEALKPNRENLKQLHADLKALWATQKSNWEAMKAARQANDVTQMQAIMNQIIGTRQDINAKLVAVQSTLEQMLQILQSTPAPQPPVTPGAAIGQ